MRAVVAKALIYNPEGRVLVLRRSLTHPKWPQEIDFPGGDVEKNESPENAIIREIQEETGLSVSACDLILNLERINGEKDNLVFKVAIKEANPDVKLSWEHSSYSWMTEDELLDIKSPTTDPFFEAIILALKI